MTEIRIITDPTEAVPLLSELRSALAGEVFHARLTAAFAAGYNLVGLERDGALVGVLGYRVVHDICWGKTLYVDDLNVAPTQRGSGIGGRLLDAAKTAAREADCDHIRLCSGLTRADAHRFYETHGMQGFSKQFVLALKGG